MSLNATRLAKTLITVGFSLDCPLAPGVSFLAGFRSSLVTDKTAISRLCLFDFLY